MLLWAYDEKSNCGIADKLATNTHGFSRITRYSITSFPSLIRDVKNISDQVNPPGDILLFHNSLDTTCGREAALR